MAIDSFLAQKIRAGFDHLDADGDGFLDESDHVLMGRRAAAALGYDPGSPAERQMIESYCRIWKLVHQPHDLDGDGKVTKEDFLASTLSLSTPGAPGANALAGLANMLFDIADVDGDGAIQLEEYFAFQQGHSPRLTEDVARLAFAHLDLNSDGSISREELASAIEEYWTSEDPQAPGNWFFGAPPESG
jgi:Ca2+-binding EF-hand superfamily protein